MSDATPPTTPAAPTDGAGTPPSPVGPSALQMTQTAANRPWLLKMIAFLVLLVGFGLWGLYDATSLYPTRGARHASFAKYQYLQLAKDKGRLDGRIGVDDPRAELERLRRARAEGTLDSLEEAKLDWLTALVRVSRLNPEQTRIADATKTFDELEKEWTTGGKARAAPKPLAAYDIPVQWLFTVLGLGGGAYLLVHILRVSKRRYQWDPAAQRLTLPDGSNLLPADIEDFDKRKWDKFLIFLKVRPGHQPHGGRELKLDLYHHYPLEDWVLAMERTRFPERAAEQQAKAEPAASA